MLFQPKKCSGRFDIVAGGEEQTQRLGGRASEEELVDEAAADAEADTAVPGVR
jgi:hypothetical protein